jgi:peptidyl-Asp metalloendopeptidase
LTWLAASANAQQAPELFEAVDDVAVQALRAAALGPRVLRQQFVRLNTQALDADGTSPSDRVILNLFPDARYEFRRLGRAEALPGGNFLWRAVGGDADSGYALLVIGAHGVRGSVSDGAGRYFKIVPASGTAQEIREVSADVPDMGNDYVLPPNLPQQQAARLPLLAAEPIAVGPVAQSAASTIDVLVVYSPNARQAAGGAANVQALADLVFAEMNQALTASQVNARVRLVKLQEVSFPSGEAITSSFLDSVRNSASIRSLRDQYGADLVSVWIDGTGNTVGLGYVMTQANSGFASFAYSVAFIDWVDGPAYAFAHEAGHNLGSGHDRNTGCDLQAFSYACGYQQRTLEPHFHTIMAYQSGCTQCPKINQYANPNVTYQGIPTGIASGPEAADNGRAFNQTAPVARQFRAAVIPEVTCDLSGDGSVNVIDVQLSVNQALGTAACGTADVSLDGQCNVIDVQRLVNAALGLGCQVGS